VFKMTKELKQRILNNEYPDILKKKDLKEFEKTGNISKELMGQILMRDAFTLKVSLNSPAQHRVIDLGISEFKRKIKEDFPHWRSSRINEAIRLYKKKAWVDFAETVGLKGSFPTH